ncbi:hypothetical protein PENTCL1PPCAC_23570, partial [Pristionchus entomophagus]
MPEIVDESEKKERGDHSSIDSEREAESNHIQNRSRGGDALNASATVDHSRRTPVHLGDRKI